MADRGTALCGPKGAHEPHRAAVRHGTDAGSVVVGGRQVPVRRPRVRTANRTAEVAVPAYELFSNTELLGGLALERMMAKLSTRQTTPVDGHCHGKDRVVDHPKLHRRRPCRSAMASGEGTARG